MAASRTLRPAREPGDAEQDKPNDERAERVFDVDSIHPRLEARHKRGKAASGNQPVRDGERKGHKPEKPGDEWHRFGHASGVPQHRASAKRAALG